ncbi:hypothetical protein BC829DRAFT_395116 [Chytridium lagenaria]|nr:hypothetical protein BC829DRAFT_395116 [Chytridium lagenaria]
MGLRDADFGFGQPRFAGPPYIPVLDGFTIFADAEYGTPGSIDVIIGLRSEHMVEFEALFAEPWLERLKVAV